MKSVLRIRYLLPLTIFIVGSGWLYLLGKQAWDEVHAQQWHAKVPELPDEPAQLPVATVLPSLVATRDRPLFWETRKPQPLASAGAVVVEPPRLLGVVLEPGQTGWVVLSQGAPPQRRVHRLRVGQSAGGYTVKAISVREVELTGPNGSITLRPPRLANP